MSRVLRPAQQIIGHFGDESFQAIICTGTDKNSDNTIRCYCYAVTLTANVVMAEYFSPSTAATGYHGCSQTSLPIILDTDLQLVGLKLKTSADLAGLREEKVDVLNGKN